MNPARRRVLSQLGLGLSVLLTVAGCASTTAATPVRAAAPTPVGKASSRDLAGLEVALFVRDSTERGLTLSSLLLTELRRRGVACRLVTAGSEPTPSWSLDVTHAEESGADYALRVSVVSRSERSDQIHQPEIVTQRATGIVIGPSSDQAPIDFPELNAPGGLEHRDVGGTDTRQDLRLEVMASLRRVGHEDPIARWTATEGTLRQLGTMIARNQADPWPLVYRAVASRLADLIVDRLKRELR